MINGSDAITSANELEDYLHITETGGAGLLANCVTGLGPTDSDNNTILGGWYFGGSQVTNQGCSGDGVTVLDSEYVGVYQLQQCGTFTTAVEGVYTCVVLNSDMIQESRRLGVYFDRRSKSYAMSHCTVISLSMNVAVPMIDRPSSLDIIVALGSSLMLSCTSRGSPPDIFTWRKDDSIFVQASNVTPLVYNDNDAVFQADHYINNITTSDSGTYTCTVTNPIGSDNATVNVHVVGM